MPTNIEFIKFAVNQMKEAIRFGFTANEANRNLKIAIHQYWQNKTLGQHGQGRKSSLPRSKAALQCDIKDLEVEHAVPLQVLVNMMIEESNIDDAIIEKILKKYFYVMLVTKEEHARLRTKELRYSMPFDWDKEDRFARYKVVGIEVDCTA